MSESNDKQKPIDRIRKIVGDKRTAVIDGVPVDVMTAQTVVKVYDGASSKRREKLDRLSAKRLVAKAYDLSEGQ